jgi:hypothetical protein
MQDKDLAYCFNSLDIALGASIIHQSTDDIEIDRTPPSEVAENQRRFL